MHAPTVHNRAGTHADMPYIEKTRPGKLKKLGSHSSRLSRHIYPVDKLNRLNS